MSRTKDYTPEEEAVILTADSPQAAWEAVKLIDSSRSYNAVRQKYYGMRQKEKSNSKIVSREGEMLIVIPTGLKAVIKSGSKEIVIEDDKLSVGDLVIQIA